MCIFLFAIQDLEWNSTWEEFRAENNPFSHTIADWVMHHRRIAWIPEKGVGISILFSWLTFLCSVILCFILFLEFEKKSCGTFPDISLYMFFGTAWQGWTPWSVGTEVSSRCSWSQDPSMAGEANDRWHGKGKGTCSFICSQKWRTLLQGVWATLFRLEVQRHRSNIQDSSF